MKPVQARALIAASSPGYAYFSERQLDYIREGLEAIERSRQPGADFRRCMRQARDAAKLARLCGRLSQGGPS